MFMFLKRSLASVLPARPGKTTLYGNEQDGRLGTVDEDGVGRLLAFTSEVDSVGAGAAAHAARTDNPHATTAAQVGAETPAGAQAKADGALADANAYTDSSLAAAATAQDARDDGQDAAISAAQADIDAHEARTDNPHATTKAQVGLGNADNTSDADKPVSTAQAAADAVVQASADAHAARTDNPHSTTAAQVGAYTTAQADSLLAANATNDRARANHTGTQLASTISDFASTVRATVLNGLSLASNAVIGAADTVLSALGRLQKQISDNLDALTSHTSNTSNPHSTTAAQVGAYTTSQTDSLLATNATNDRARANHTGTQLAATISDFSAAADARIDAQKGTANGLATLDAGQKVPAAQLPSYVDDVLEFADLASFPATGETGKIYTALDTGKIYRWGGSAYTEISASPGSTDAVPEGVTNLYFTTGRASAAAPVQSVFGRVGAVVAVVGDYTAALITYAANAVAHWPGGSSPATVALALDALAARVRSASTVDVAVDADLTLTDAQANAQRIAITDTGVVLTANRNVVIEARAHLFSFTNLTTRTLTVKTPAGAGVAVAAGARTLLGCDGTDVLVAGSVHSVGGKTGVVPFQTGAETSTPTANGNTGTDVTAALAQTLNTSSTSQTKTGSVVLGTAADTANRLTVHGDAFFNRGVRGSTTNAFAAGTSLSTLRGVMLGSRDSAVGSGSASVWEWYSDNMLIGHGTYNTADLSATGSITLANVLGLLNRPRTLDTATLVAGGQSVISLSSAAQTRLISASDNGLLIVKAQAGLTFRVDFIKTGVTTTGTTYTISAADSNLPVVIGNYFANANAETTVITIDNPTAGALTINQIGSFTTLAPKSRQSFGPVSPHYRTGFLDFGGAAGIVKQDRITTNALLRWAYGSNATGEGGSNAGSDYVINRYSDAGSLLSAALTITRSTGDVTLSSALAVGGSIRPASNTVATLPATATIGDQRYCTNCRNITGFTSTLAGNAATPVQEGSGAGTGNAVVWRTVGGTTGWYVVGPLNTLAVA